MALGLFLSYAVIYLGVIKRKLFIGETKVTGSQVLMVVLLVVAIVAAVTFGATNLWTVFTDPTATPRITTVLRFITGI